MQLKAPAGAKLVRVMMTIAGSEESGREGKGACVSQDIHVIGGGDLQFFGLGEIEKVGDHLVQRPLFGDSEMTFPNRKIA